MTEVEIVGTAPPNSPQRNLMLSLLNKGLQPLVLKIATPDQVEGRLCLRGVSQ